MKNKKKSSIYLSLFAWILILIPFGAMAQNELAISRISINQAVAFPDVNRQQDNFLEITPPHNGSVQLKWQVNCTNTIHFEIERSLDGKSFFHIGGVSGTGSSSGVNKYHYTDRNFQQVKVPVVYYRLWMLDAKGNDTYSQVVTVVMDGQPSSTEPLFITAAPQSMASL